MEKAVTFDEVWKLVKETAAIQKENERIFKAGYAKTEAFLESVGKQLGSIGNNNGAAAEDYFYNSFSKSLEFAHMHFDLAEKNEAKSSKKIKDEYDIVLYNDTSVVIIEVKYKASEADIPKVLNKLTTFKILSPKYKDYTLYLGLASFSFTKAVEKAALAAGIAVIKQVGDTVVVMDKNMKKF